MLSGVVAEANAFAQQPGSEQHGPSPNSSTDISSSRVCIGARVISILAREGRRFPEHAHEPAGASSRDARFARVL